MNEPILFAQALADETRWRILRLVFDDALCVCELADILHLPQSTLSSHLQVIRKANLLESERCEKWVYYKVGKPFRPLLGSIFRHFETDPAQSARAQADAKIKSTRLAKRDDCDCPGPKTLPKLARQRSKALVE